MQFVKVPTHLLDSDLSPVEKLIWMAVRKRQGRNEWCFASRRLIAQDIHVRKATAVDAIRALIECGWLVINEEKHLQCAGVKRTPQSQLNLDFEPSAGTVSVPQPDEKSVRSAYRPGTVSVPHRSGERTASVRSAYPDLNREFNRESNRAIDSARKDGVLREESEAVRIYREITRVDPPMYFRDLIAFNVKDDPDSLSLWGAVCETWAETPNWNERQAKKMVEDFLKQRDSSKRERAAPGMVHAKAATSRVISCRTCDDSFIAPIGHEDEVCPKCQGLNGTESTLTHSEIAAMAKPK